MEEVATPDGMLEITRGRLIITLQPTLTATRPWNWMPSTRPNNMAKDQPTVTIEEGAAGYLYSQCPPNLETRLTGQGDHVQGSHDLHGTGSHDL